MKIMEILARDAVILDLGVRTKREVLAEMAAALAKVEPQIEADRLLEVLLEREALQSTGIGEGVAIPHGKLNGLDRLVATFARSREGIDFESIDGQPTQHFFLLVVPARSGGPYREALPGPIKPPPSTPKKPIGDTHHPHSRGQKMGWISIRW